MRWLATLMAFTLLTTGLDAQEYRFTLPAREVVIQVPQPKIQLQQAASVQQAQTQPPVIIMQENGNGNGNGNGPQPPINPPDPDREIEEIRARVAVATFINSHFKVKRGILGLGILPCVSLTPRRVTDPAVRQYYELQDYLRRKQIEAWIRSNFATIQPVPEQLPAVSAYGGYR